MHQEDIINGEIPCVHRLEKLILLKLPHYSYLQIQYHSSLITCIVMLWLILSHTFPVMGKIKSTVSQRESNMAIPGAGTLKTSPAFSMRTFLSLWSEIITKGRGGRKNHCGHRGCTLALIPKAHGPPRLWSSCTDTDSENMGSPLCLGELCSPRHLLLEFFCLLL